jgi:tetraacyldisaccharide 4'-kinase
MLRGAGLPLPSCPCPTTTISATNPFAGVDADVILITEKDAVKCGQLENLKDDPRLWVVPVTARIDAALAEQIVEKCRGRSPA